MSLLTWWRKRNERKHKAEILHRAAKYPIYREIYHDFQRAYEEQFNVFPTEVERHLDQEHMLRVLYEYRGKMMTYARAYDQSVENGWIEEDEE